MATVSGECVPWPTKRELSSLLTGAGFQVRTGPYSLSLGDCANLQIQGFAVSVLRPFFGGEASASELLHEAALLSAALTAVNVKHRIEVRDDDAVVGYVHHRWPEPAR